jgi:type IV pilus assembly protein PilY1
MQSKVDKVFKIAPCFVVLALMSAMFPAVADDTEIYQAEYDATSNGARAKVLIVFDDSGSMSTMVEQQRPEYDSEESYTASFPVDRIYWSTTGNVPATDSSDWFSASKNRCASSYDSLDGNGRFTAERARRWVDSTVQQGQCSSECPVGTVYRDPSGPNNAGCYQQTTTSVPVTKLVYVQNDSSGNNCGNLIYVDPPGGSNDACYQEVTSSNPVSGWIYRLDDRRNNWCPSGTDRLYVDPPGGWNAYDACFELVTAAEFTQVTDWQWSGPLVEVCEADTDVPGSWESLTSSVQSPTHVECRDDVTDSIGDNGAGQNAGYPQNNVLNGSEYGPSADSTVQWGGSPYTFYTSHYLNWYHDDSLVAPRSRLDIAQEVISTIISTNTSIDFGLMEFNFDEGGRIAHRIIAGMSAAQRTNLIGLVNQMDHAGSTPMCESMYEAYNYLAGRNVEYGNSAITGSDSRGVYDVLPKDPLAEINGKYISPNTECAYTYVILMTDGFPQRDIGANLRIKSITGKGCSNYEDANGNITENCLPQLTEYMANNDLAPNTDGDQFGITYTIGFTTDQALLKDAAENGKGEYYTANNAQQLTEAFQGAIVGILSAATTFTSPAVAVDTFSRTQSRDEVFYAMFKPGSTVDWIGNIKKLKIDASGVLVDAGAQPALDPVTGDINPKATTFWSTDEDGSDVGKGGVGALLAARNPATRTLYSNTGANSALQTFDTTNFTAVALGLVSNVELFSLLGASNQTSFNNQMAWAQGFDAYDRDGDSNTSEPRNWLLGDILHSQPLVLNYGALGAASNQDPDLRLLVGSNSGFVHMFGNSDGQEDWAFFPKELAAILPLRRRNAASNDNVYGMDLTPVAYTFDSNNDGTLDATDGDKAWVYLGLRRGGSAYYALDMSDPDSPSFMWRIDPSSAGFGELGQSWSEPTVTTIPGYKDSNDVMKPVLIFGAGYDINKDASGVGTPDGSGRGIFIVDAQTGALVWSVTPAIKSAKNLSEPGLLHSVPGGVTVLDSNGDEITDRIYFGDTGGNLWRIDLPGSVLPNASQDTWQINQLGDFNGGNIDTDRRFFSPPDVVRIRLEGTAVDAVIIGTGDRTNPNATDVNNQVYMIRDIATASYSTQRPSNSDCAEPETVDFRCSLPLSDDDLYDITDNSIITGTEAEKTIAINGLSNSNGWVFDLVNDGEKNLAKTVTINGRLYVPTFTPSNLFANINSCEPQSGTGQMYIFDIYSGDRAVISLGSIIPSAPSVYFTESGKILLLLPPGAPASSISQPGEIDCEGGVCDINETLRPPYSNFWYQQES